MRDVLLAGFRSEAHLILDSKMDRKEAEEMLRDKYDREAGADCEQEIQKLKTMLQKLQSLLVIYTLFLSLYRESSLTNAR